MSDTKSQKLVLVVTHGANDDKSTVAFTVANAALTSGMEVAIFLSSDAVELSREGSSDHTEVKPFKPLAELVDSFTGRGGLVWSCAPCFNHRGLKTEETINKSVVTGAGPMLEWIAAGASTLSF
jgi:predicted peroxiredoxin